MSWWNRIDSTHLDIVFTLDGLIGVRSHLSWNLNEGRWLGTSEAFTDVGPDPQAVAPAGLTFVPCS